MSLLSQRDLNREQIATVATKEPAGDPAVARWKLDPLQRAAIRDETGHGHEGTPDVDAAPRSPNGTDKPPAAERAVREPAQPPASEAARSPSRTAQVVSGTWGVDEKELVQRDREGTILLGVKELSSYDLIFQGQIAAGKEGFVALFHRTSDENVSFFHVGELGGKEAHSGFLHQGKEGGKAKPVSLVKGRWYHVLVKVRGAESWCFLDGQELFHDIDDRFTHGRVGLATWDASARFREIAITTPEGEVLWSGLPQLRSD
jgi:eukaryotic-like serine/threonine-protein kinase